MDIVAMIYRPPSMRMVRNRDKAQTSVRRFDMTAIPTMTRAEIMARANAMIDLPWTPAADIRVQERGENWHVFQAGVTYRGVAYNWWGDDDIETFRHKVHTTAGGDILAGNDCSSFVGHAWQLPERLTTTGFEDDATGNQEYCWAIGGKGECQGAGLRPGDACNLAAWHIILVGEVRADGIISAEQTPGPRITSTEMRRFWSWDWLRDHEYRPIRRLGIRGEDTWTLRWPAVPGATWYRLWIDRDGKKHVDEWLRAEGRAEWTAPVGLPGGRYRWWVLDWSQDAKSGPWLVGPDFIVPRPSTPGFTVEQGESE